MVKIKLIRKKNNQNKTQISATIQKTVVDKKKKFSYYLPIDHDDFEKVINMKKEFYKFKIPKEKKTIEQLCSETEFSLRPTQEFLRNYISIQTPYNGILIFHGTGVGKTCAAVSVAEGFKEEMKHIHGEKRTRKIMVIVNRNIKDNFLKTIYDYNKDSKGKGQCLGKEYALPPEYKYTKEQKIREIKRRIHLVYEFLGPLVFRNQVIKRTGWDGEKDTLTSSHIEAIKREYSNRVIVIDEVHNIRSDVDSDERQVPPILEAIVRYATNIRLILMSATPMYDKPTEIVFLLNLLLLNDKRPTIKNKDVFDSDGFLSKEGEKVLRDASRGYISFLRGENPASFPARDYPDGRTPHIVYDMYGKVIPDIKRLKHLKLFECLMSDYQFEAYQNYLMTVLKNTENGNSNEESVNSNENDENMEDEETINTEEKPLMIEKNKSKNEEISKGIFQGLQFASNIVYANKDGDAVFEKDAFQNKDNGEGAFVQEYVENPYTKKKFIQFKYQKHTLDNIGTKDEVPFLDETRLGLYSQKFKKALELIKQSRGICYVYSEYVKGGVLPFALMLEQNGFTRYVEPNSGEKPLLNYHRNILDGGGKRLPICALCAKTAADKIHLDENIEGYHRFKSARYVIITGKTDITKMTPAEAVAKLNDVNNKYGEEIKVVVGTRRTGEGIDFKRIRQTHILEPWYNLSRLEQIIGRSIRDCSHFDLKAENRLVDIFQYVSMPPLDTSKKIKETETIDVRRYRMAEVKDRKIKEVEEVLRKNAVDCWLNKNANLFVIEDKKKMINSIGQEVDIQIGDVPNTRNCYYKDNCNIKCYYEPEGVVEVDKDTYGPIFAKTDIEKIKTFIRELFRVDYIYTLEQIEKYVKEKDNSLELEFIYLALNDFIKNKEETIQDRYDRVGHLQYAGKYYIFSPDELPEAELPLYYRSQPFYEQKKEVKLEVKQIEGEETDKVKKKDKRFREFKEKSLLTTDIIKEILEKYEKMMDEYADLDIKNKKYVIMSYLRDRINEKQLPRIIEHFIFMIKDGKSLNEEELVLFSTFQPFLLFSKKGNKDVLYGYKIRNTLICYDELVKKFTECPGSIKKEVLDKIGNKKENVNIQKIFGVLFFDKKGEPNFKIIDKEKETKTETVEGRKSKRAESKGRVCKTYKRFQLEDILKKIQNTQYKDKKYIDEFCVEIELILRDKDKPNNRSFFNQYEETP